MEDLFNTHDNGAHFSECKKHRYALWRIWDSSKPNVMVIGLNPSTANESDNDPTIKKVIKVARNNGFGGVYMMNLFSFVTAYPEQLIKDDNSLNDTWLSNISKLCSKVVYAWGNFKIQPRDQEVMMMFPEAFAFHINKNGSPKHPLYCLDITEFIRYSSVDQSILTKNQ
jgi:hypothetical protein